METIRSLYKKFNRPIFNRIENQFGNLCVTAEIDSGLSNSEIFRRVTYKNGRGKSHSSGNYPKNEGKKKNS